MLFPLFYLFLLHFSLVILPLPPFTLTNSGKTVMPPTAQQVVVALLTADSTNAISLSISIISSLFSPSFLFLLPHNHLHLHSSHSSLFFFLPHPFFSFSSSSFIFDILVSSLTPWTITNTMNHRQHNEPSSTPWTIANTMNHRQHNEPSPTPWTIANTMNHRQHHEPSST